jgi:hypothetical protein
MSTSSPGVMRRLAVDDVLPFDTSSLRHEIIDETLTASYMRIYNEGIRGTLTRSGDRTRRGPITVAGSITMNPTPVELDWWLYRLMGTAKAGSDFALADTIPEFQLLIDKVGQVHQFTGCKAVSGLFSASSGGPLILTVNIVGKVPTAPGSIAFPAISIADEQPYIFSDCSGAIVLDSVAHEADQLQISINNIAGPRANNSQFVTDIPILDREISVGFTTPWGASQVSHFNNLVSADENFASTITFTNGGLSVLFTFPHLEATNLQTPAGGGKGELLLPHNYMAYGTGASKEMVVTTDIAA